MFLEFKEIGNDVREVIFYLTNDTNIECDYLPPKGKQYMSFKVIDAMLEKIIKIFKDYRRVYTITFKGGEPLICWDKITYIIDKLKENNVICRYKLHTNLTLMTLAKAKVIKANAIDVVGYLDGEEEHNNKHRSGYKEAIRGLTCLRELNILKTHVTIHMTLMEDTIKYFEDNFDFVSKLGVKSILFEPADSIDITGRFKTNLKKATKYAYEQYFKFTKNKFDALYLTSYLDYIVPDYKDTSTDSNFFTSGQLYVSPYGKIYANRLALVNNTRHIGNVYSNQLVFPEPIDIHSHPKCRGCVAKNVCQSCSDIATFDSKYPHQNICQLNRTIAEVAREFMEDWKYNTAGIYNKKIKKNIVESTSIMNSLYVKLKRTYTINDETRPIIKSFMTAYGRDYICERNDPPEKLKKLYDRFKIIIGGNNGKLYNRIQQTSSCNDATD